VSLVELSIFSFVTISSPLRLSRPIPILRRCSFPRFGLNFTTLHSSHRSAFISLYLHNPGFEVTEQSLAARGRHRS
jgi:hypothetical protein